MALENEPWQRDAFIDILTAGKLEFEDHDTEWFPDEKVKCHEVYVPALKQSWYFRKADGTLFKVVRDE